VTKIAVKRESGCRKSQYRRLRDIERPRYIGLRVSVGKPLDSFLPLVRCQRSRASEFHATGLSALPAFACAGRNQLALKLGQATGNRAHQPAVRGRGARRGDFQPAETGFMPAPRGRDGRAVRRWETPDAYAR